MDIVFDLDFWGAFDPMDTRRRGVAKGIIIYDWALIRS